MYNQFGPNRAKGSMSAIPYGHLDLFTGLGSSLLFSVDISHSNRREREREKLNTRIGL